MRCRDKPSWWDAKRDFLVRGEEVEGLETLGVRGRECGRSSVGDCSEWETESNLATHIPLHHISFCPSFLNPRVSSLLTYLRPHPSVQITIYNSPKTPLQNVPQRPSQNALNLALILSALFVAASERRRFLLRPNSDCYVPPQYTTTTSRATKLALTQPKRTSGSSGNSLLLTTSLQIQNCRFLLRLPGTLDDRRPCSSRARAHQVVSEPHLSSSSFRGKNCYISRLFFSLCETSRLGPGNCNLLSSRSFCSLPIEPLENWPSLNLFILLTYC